jgi:hypothetical protein
MGVMEESHGAQCRSGSPPDRAAGSGKDDGGSAACDALQASRASGGRCLLRFVVSGYAEPWLPDGHEQNRAVMRIVADAAAGYADAGYFTIVDGILIPGLFLEQVRDALVKRGNG